jgi:hypothetical protein
MSLLRGRLFTPDDERSHRSIMVVDEAFCRRFVGGADPLEATLWFGGDPLRVVGVVGDQRQPTDPSVVSRTAVDDGAVYLLPDRLTRPPTWRFVVFRSLPQRPETAAAVVDTLISIDPSAVVGDPLRFDELLSRYFADRRRLSVLLGLMGAVILLLTLASLTAALSQLVTLRSAEIALRRCLGAGRRHILGLMVTHVGGTVGCGLLIGVTAGLALGHGLRHQLYGVEATDAGTLVSTVGLLLIIVTLAAVGPARRAVKVDVTDALRSN